MIGIRYEVFSSKCKIPSVLGSFEGAVLMDENDLNLLKDGRHTRALLIPLFVMPCIIPPRLEDTPVRPSLPGVNKVKPIRFNWIQSILRHRNDISLLSVVPFDNQNWRRSEGNNFLHQRNSASPTPFCVSSNQTAKTPNDHHAEPDSDPPHQYTIQPFSYW
ncbi:unnamed protein product [Haemonchus placei]|uniref:Uncharacterized protein n=1 Tax=Haemonchus placei TaxID=6290 RepID=A0A0N4WJC6_HAEPC|nr:unnamed protein product [Haemonchus placei]